MASTADPDPIQTTPTLNPPPNNHIFILSGQSNMAGRGGVSRKTHKWDAIVPPQSQPHPSIYRLSKKLHWEAAREPLHHDIDTRKTCGVGPGMAFANAVVAAAAAAAVAVVPCAVGGTAIREWARGEKLYEDMVKRARASVKGGGQIKAVLWFQGESDTITDLDAGAYQRNMEALVANVRRDLALPSLPIIQVALASGLEYKEKVREAQLGMKMENVVCVDAKGLELQEDNLHLSTPAQVTLGQMLADAYLSNFVHQTPKP